MSLLQSGNKTNARTALLLPDQPKLDESEKVLDNFLTFYAKRIAIFEQGVDISTFFQLILHVNILYIVTSFVVTFMKVDLQSKTFRITLVSGNIFISKYRLE